METRKHNLGSKTEVHFIPNIFDSVPLQDTIKHIGDARHYALIRKANVSGWNEERLEAEIRAVADEVYWHPESRTPQSIIASVETELPAEQKNEIGVFEIKKTETHPAKYRVYFCVNDKSEKRDINWGDADKLLDTFDKRCDAVTFLQARSKPYAEFMFLE